jgi:DNA-binding transcriptional regulator WhiA
LNEWASTQRRQYQKTPKSGAQNFTKTVETILEKMGQKKREEFIRHLITNKRDYKTFSLEALKTIIQRVISKKYLAGLTNKDLQDIGQLMFKDENSSNLQKIKKV